MYKIYIDTTKRYEKKIAVYEANDNEGWELVDEKNGDIDVASAIKQIFLEQGINNREVIAVDVNKGPGSFTGLKIGVTVANVMNWALGLSESDSLIVPNYGAEPNIQR